MKTLLLTLTLACTGAFAHAQQADDILGEWYSESRNLVFEITRNDVGRYEGKIIWSEDPNRKDKFGKSLVGMTTLTDLFYTSDGRYEKGAVYAPKRGRTLDATAQFNPGEKPEADQLEITASAGFISRKRVWTRKTNPTPRQ